MTNSEHDLLMIKCLVSVIEEHKEQFVVLNLLIEGSALLNKLLIGLYITQTLSNSAPNASSQVTGVLCSTDLRRGLDRMKG